jgi:hypothetical protein
MVSILNCRAVVQKDFPGISSQVPEPVEGRYSSSSLCIPNGAPRNCANFYQNYRVKTYSLKSTAKNQDTNTVWDAFVDYLETVYFMGAADELDKELVEFEYESYRICYEK